MSLFCWVLLLILNLILIESFEFSKILCTLTTLWTWDTKIIWVLLEWSNNLTPQKKSGRSFSHWMKPSWTKVHLRMVKAISLGIPIASLYINKNLGLQIFEILFFEHYASFVKLGASSILFCFGVASLPFVDLHLWGYSNILSLKEERRRNKNSRKKRF
jgi:hypothetical protein